jgi:hypothetical protein
MRPRQKRRRKGGWRDAAGFGRFVMGVTLIGGVWRPISINADVVNPVSSRAFGLDQMPRNREDSDQLCEHA